MASYSILYVDDEKENLTSFKYLFKKNYHVALANSAQEGLEALKEEDIQVVISDQRMPGMTGVEFLEKVSSQYPNVVRILLTGYNDISLSEQEKIYKCISKPFEVAEMKNTLSEAFELYERRIHEK